VNFDSLAVPGEVVPADIVSATSQTFAGVASLLARVAAC
jgi:hypothetical protein